MTKLTVTFHNSANCLKMNLKIKHTVIWEVIIVLPPVFPVCELLEQMTKNAKSKIIPSTQSYVLVNPHIGAELKQGLYTKIVTSYSIKIQDISNSIEINSRVVKIIPRCNNCGLFFANAFTLHVSGDNPTHHQEYMCCIWPQVSRHT